MQRPDAATSRQTQPAAPKKNTGEAANNSNTGNTSKTTSTQAAAQAEASKQSQAELQTKKREVDSMVQQGKKAAANGNFTEAQNTFSKAAAQMPSGDAVFTAEEYREMADALQTLSKKAPAQKDQALKTGSDYIKK